MSDAPPLILYNSLTRALEPFQPIHAGQARVYSCGPTVYHYAHIGNLRAYIFADTLGRTLAHFGYDLRHIINITDVGHLTDDADAGEDKLEKAAGATQSAWDIAAHYTQAFKDDCTALNIRPPAQWSVASEYVPAMIAFARGITDAHCYELPGGLYFDTSTVADYGRLARAAKIDDAPDAGEHASAGRIEAVSGKRHAADFAIWRRTPPGETRQMDWDSPWGRGAPGWHLECSVMSGQLLGFPFDIHTGGIDHREIHHPNEIAQNQAYCHSADTGARICPRADTGANIWMHNNFLIERREDGGAGKMSKSSGEFLRLQVLIDRGYHPLAYRLMCLQAHYRSELEFSWGGLGAALTRLTRVVTAVQKARQNQRGEIVVYTADAPPQTPRARATFESFERAVSEDLNTPDALRALESALIFADEGPINIGENLQLSLVATFDQVLGLHLLTLTRADLRIRPTTATITEPEIETILAQRKTARAAKDFATSDTLRDHLIAHGVEIMDGDPLGWDWRL